MKRGQKLRIIKEDIDHPFPLNTIVYFEEAIHREDLIWVSHEELGMCLVGKDEYEEA